MKLEVQRIELETQNKELLQVEDGEHIFNSLQDYGVGIPQGYWTYLRTVLHHKTPIEGTGLGLSISASILSNN
jgi:C4-dicarboxylate-specific signal transduction histidine kinase